MNDLRKELVVEYLFDGGANDTSGNGHHARVEGATLTENRFGEKDRAYAFSGQGDFIVIDQSPVFNAKAFSLSVWVKYDQESTLKGWNSAIISQDDHGRVLNKSQRVFQLSTKGEYVTWHQMLQSSDVVGKSPIQREVWYHLVTVYDGSNHKLFVNGEFQDSQKGRFSPNEVEPIYIGKKNSNESIFWFHGIIDDIRIFKRIVSEKEILELYMENDSRR